MLNKLTKEHAVLCNLCRERVAEYDVGGGVCLCKRCYEEMHFNIFQQIKEFGVF